MNERLAYHLASKLSRLLACGSRLSFAGLVLFQLANLAELPRLAGAEERTLNRFAAEVACLPGASPLPLDLFSLAGGALGEDFTVRFDRVDGEVESLALLAPAGSRLRLPGIAAVELVWPDSVDFTVDNDCGDGAMSFRSDDFTLTVRLKPDPAFFPRADGGGGAVEASQAVRLDVAYTVAEGRPLVTLHPAGGAGAAVFALGAPFAIGTTGVVVESADLSLRSTGDAARPFGIGLDNVKLSFPSEILSFLEDELEDRSLNGLFSIEGTGLSGSLRHPPEPRACPRTRLFDEGDFCFQELDLAFTENALTRATILGRLKPPFFKDLGLTIGGCGGGDGDLALEISLHQDGEVRVAIDCPEGDPFRLALDGIFTLTVKGIDFERPAGGGYRFRMDGDLEMAFLTRAGGDRTLTIPIERLTVSSEGDISLDGGWVRLRRPEKFGFHGFDVAIRGVSFGSAREGGRTRTWIGLDADLSLTDLLPLGGSVKGFRAIWDNGDPLGSLKLEMDGIAIDFRQPGVASMKGDIRWAGNDGGGAEDQVFRGDVRLALEAINLTVDAQLSVGRSGGTKFFFVQLFGEFPTGIPVFPGVSLYGLGGLFASNLKPNLDDPGFATPLLWYAEEAKCPGSTDPCTAGKPAPWRLEDGALNFGAGALLGSADNGYAVHAKAALLVSIPGPLITFNGKANLLKKRGSLSRGADPIFNAYITYDPGNAFEMGVGVNYELAPVLKIKGDAEAFFSLMDPSLWHVYLGQVGGREIQAKVVELFKSKAFLMIHPERDHLAADGSQFDLCPGIPTPDLAFGAGAGFDEDYSFGPLGVALRALIAAWAGISFDPIHFQGGSDLDGGVELRAFGFSLGIDVAAHLLFQTPKPYVLDGDFRVKLKLPWPFPDPKATVHLRWEKRDSPRPVDPVLKEVQLTARDGSGGMPAIWREDAAIPADFGEPVPLDFVPNLIFNRPMNDETAPRYFGGDLAEPSPFEDAVRGGCDERGPDPSSLRYSYHLTRAEVSVQPAGAVAAFPEGAAAGPQPQGVWLPEPRQDEDLEAVGYPSRVLVLYDPNPFSHLAASGLLIDEGGGGGGGARGRGGADSKVGLAEWMAAHLPCLPPCRRPTQGIDFCDCPGPGTSVGEPCTLPPYAVYRIKAATQVRENVDGAVRALGEVARYAYFQTAGPPLDLAPYIHEILPGIASRPHFQDYHLAVRFNQGYLDALYHSGDAGGALICSGEPGLRARLLDSSRKALRAESRVASYFADAADHVEPVHDGGAGKGPAAVFAELGGRVLPDDVLHIPTDADAALPPLRPGERHLVQILWQDARLADDARPGISDEERRAGEKVLFEFPILLSRFRDLRHLFSSFAEPGMDCDWSRGAYRGSFFDLAADVSDDDWGAAMEVLDGLARFQADHPGLAAYASRLRDAHPAAAPTGAGERTLRIWLDRVQALVQTFDGMAGAELVVGNAELPLLREGWERERAAFDQLDRILGLERRREPLPEVVELSVLKRGGEVKGFLLELPEPLDFGRISEISAVQGFDQGLLVVKNPAGSRLLFFSYDLAGRDLRVLPGGKWTIEMSYQGILPGWLEPALRRTDGFEQEGAAICFDLSTDLFR